MLTGGGTAILGAGHAGFATASALRAAGAWTAQITLVDHHEGLPYQRLPISKAYRLGKVDRSRVTFRPATYCDRRGIALVSGRSATAVDRATRTVELESGDAFGYDELVLATSARPRLLPVPGPDLDGVMVLRTPNRGELDAR